MVRLGSVRITHFSQIHNEAQIYTLVSIGTLLNNLLVTRVLFSFRGCHGAVNQVTILWGSTPPESTSVNFFTLKILHGNVDVKTNIHTASNTRKLSLYNAAANLLKYLTSGSEYVYKSKGYVGVQSDGLHTSGSAV
jgi:hypothetical protein